jgi:hypothetical protein
LEALSMERPSMAPAGSAVEALDRDGQHISPAFPVEKPSRRHSVEQANMAATGAGQPDRAPHEGRQFERADRPIKMVTVIGHRR